jgi:hypothetical protein
MTHESDGRVTDVVQQGGGKLALVGRKPKRPVPPAVPLRWTSPKPRGTLFVIGSGDELLRRI